MLDIILKYERKKIIEILINNSIIYKNNSGNNSYYKYNE